MSNQDTTHTIRYEQPGILSSLPYNKVAQFGLGIVIIMVAWRAYWTGWFSAFAFTHVMEAPASDGFGSPIGLIPFAIDAVCLVGIGGFALIGLIRGTVGPLLGGLPEWLASLMAGIRGESAATQAAASIRTTSGKEISQVDAMRQLFARLKKLEDKTADLPEPEPPPPPMTPEETAKLIADMQAKINELEKPAARTTRAKS